MRGNFTILTPTGDRPQAFDLCQTWIAGQTLHPRQWIVVDDGQEVTQPTSSFITNFVRRNRGTERMHTLPFNILAALPLIVTPIVIMVEDDEWYAPEYLEKMYSLLSQKDVYVAGQANSLYYRLPTREHRYCGNTHHASLCVTGFRTEALQSMMDACTECIAEAVPFVDMKLWGKFPGGKLTHDHLHVGMKGLPGRPGTTMGWRKDVTGMGWTPDPKLEALYSFIGPDIEFYKPIMKGAGLWPSA